MASSASGHRSTVPCRYFTNGRCRDGNRCRFSHEHTADSSVARFCKYYQRGNCSYGEFCKFEHARPRNTRDQNSGAIGGANQLQSSSKSDQLADLLRKTKLRPEAQEFIPGQLTVSGNNESSEESAAEGASATSTKDILCPYHILGQCWYGDNCSFTHGTLCDLCDRPVLHPDDVQMNRKHRNECLAEYEQEMKEAFAVAQTKDKQCGICMDVVLEKSNASARRFGILPGCKHCFCLECIRNWRQTKQFENKIIRACPQCRTVSDFVVPSTVWVEEEEEKNVLIETYKNATKEKQCKYFRGGKMECPFGNKCFYRHVKPDGTVVTGDSPRTIRRRQRQRERREGGSGGQGGNGGNGGGRSADIYVAFLQDILEENDWHRNRMSPDDWPWEFQIDDEFDWLSLTDSESDFYDY